MRALASLCALCALCALAACAGAPLAPDVERRVQAAIADDLQAYPELAGRRFALTALDDDEAYFQSNFAVAALAPLALDYAMQANPRAFALGLDDEMLRGVIAHELGHTLDYERRLARGGLDAFAALLALAPLAALPEANAWERWTDLVAVDRGFGPALLRYRAWQLRALRAEAGAAAGAARVARKKRIYYGPLELALLVDVRARCPALFRSFLDAPPTSARAIATRCP